MQSQGGNPAGLLGRILGHMMNLMQTKVYMRVLNKSINRPDMKVLDIGCGGGRVLKVMARMVTKGEVYGIDHSPEMVALAKKVNREKDQRGNVWVIEADVSKLPFTTGMLDCVTALETVQFWPELPRSLGEVYRVLKTGGCFLIINRFPEEGSKWYDRVQIKTEGGYREYLSACGFSDICIDRNYKKGWIVIHAMK